MKNIIRLIFLSFTIFTACQEEEDLGPSIINTDPEVRNEVDEWILENYTTPYNVEVKYRWEDSEVDNDKILVPPTLDEVVPFLSTMQQVWIEPYRIEGGDEFIKTYIPKLLYLVGSRSYNNDGTITQGQAESGKKVVMYELNYFDNTNASLIKRQFHVMHHEFAHILHQTVMYPTEYSKLTPEGYTSTWFNVSNSQANEEGFITNYAKANTNEDFVEMVATMLTNSKEEWDAMIEGVASEDAKEILREKETYVTNYFSQTWNIDIYALQSRINDAIHANDPVVEPEN